MSRRLVRTGDDKTGRRGQPGSNQTAHTSQRVHIGHAGHLPQHMNLGLPIKPR
jgi:hypothetical protein